MGWVTDTNGLLLNCRGSLGIKSILINEVYSQMIVNATFKIIVESFQLFLLILQEISVNELTEFLIQPFRKLVCFQVTVFIH